MGCGCCGGPVVGGTGFVTTAKYSTTGHVMWWVDSGLANNAGIYYSGVYYELSAPVSGSNTILRSLDPITAAELDRRDLGVRRYPQHILERNGALFTFMPDTEWRVDKINTADLSSTWTHSTATSLSTAAVIRLIEGNYVAFAYKPAGVDTWNIYENGTTLAWSLGMTEVASWHCIDSNGYFVGSGSGGSPARVKIFRYDADGNFVDSYTCAADVSSVSAVAADGTTLWAKLTTAGTDRAVLLDNTLSELFSPVNISAGTGSRTFIAPVTGAAYFCTARYVSRISTSGTVSARHDHGATPQIRGFDLIGDQEAFVLLDGPSPTRLLRYDDSSAPASLEWTMNPTLQPSEITQRVADKRFFLSHDSSGNVYVTGARLADTSLDKVP